MSLEFQENFELQLAELEMLNSMFPNPHEFTVTLPSVLADMNRYISGKTKRMPNELDFTWNLDIVERSAKLEVNITLPHNYPTSKPLVSSRSIGLSREQQKELNTSISEFLEALPAGELCIISLINWLTENAQNYFSLDLPTNQTKETDRGTAERDNLCRMWIYSHHIYSKFKRREIVDSAPKLNLTGFSLPGKPGFICIEGHKRDCDDFLQQLKQMTWKKISLVKEEIELNESSQATCSFRKFEEFQEISFQVRRGPAKEYHMDMGQFFKYLEEHSCAYAFHDLFGLQGHISSDK